MEELCHVGIIQRPSVRKISEVLVLAEHFVQLCSEEFETSLNRLLGDTDGHHFSDISFAFFFIS